MSSTMNKIANSVMKPLLRSPLHFFASGGLMLITFTGRKSGKVYTTPVSYKRDGNTIVFFTQRERVWWKNLRDGAQVTLRLKGKDHTGTATVHDDQSHDELIAALKRQYPRMNDEQAADFSQRMLMITVAL